MHLRISGILARTPGAVNTPPRRGGGAAPGHGSGGGMWAFLANLNSHAYDFIMRQKVGNVHLNFFIVEQGPILPPDTYDKPCPWAPEVTLEAWISERVLKLTCTSEDMLPLADACAFTTGSFQREYAGRLHRWDPADRAHLMAQLDAAYFLLYGLTRDDAEYMLSTFQGSMTRSAGVWSVN